METAEPVSGLPGAEETQIVLDGPDGKYKTKCLLYAGEQWVTLKTLGKVCQALGMDVEVSESKGTKVGEGKGELTVD